MKILLLTVVLVVITIYFIHELLKASKDFPLDEHEKKLGE
jgi:hypothetical protein